MLSLIKGITIVVIIIFTVGFVLTLLGITTKQMIRDNCRQQGHSCSGDVSPCCAGLDCRPYKYDSIESICLPARHYLLKQETSLYDVGEEASPPADKSGITPKDVVLTFNHEPDTFSSVEYSRGNGLVEEAEISDSRSTTEVNEDSQYYIKPASWTDHPESSPGGSIETSSGLAPSRPNDGDFDRNLVLTDDSKYISVIPVETSSGLDYSEDSEAARTSNEGIQRTKVCADNSECDPGVIVKTILEYISYYQGTALKNVTGTDPDGFKGINVLAENSTTSYVTVPTTNTEGNNSVMASNALDKDNDGSPSITERT